MWTKYFSVFDMDMNHLENSDNFILNNFKLSKIIKESNDSELL